MTATTARTPAVAPQLLAADRTPISEIMTRDPMVVHPDLQVEALATLLLEQNISQVPVVDDAGKPIGFVSKTDLVLDQYVRGDTAVDQRGIVEPGTHVHEASGMVRDLMTPVAFSLPATTPLGTAARRMLADNVHAVPVIADDGRVIGILSATDFVAWVAGL